MLVTIGISFATWDMSAVKAINGDISTYANAKVGDIIEFGRYYQTGNRINNDENAEYEKTPIEWLVVDKDERTGQLTLMSKYILACGSYFGNWYDDGTGYTWHYSVDKSEIDGITYNQAYVDSTVRAYLNNLERRDIGGDTFDSTKGYIPSGINSTRDTYDTADENKFIKGAGLLSSIGFSNKRYWTNFYTTDGGNLTNLINDPKSGFIKREDATNKEIYYKRPIGNAEYINRPMTKGFFDEAFNYNEKSMIVPKVIAGYTGHRWPDNQYSIADKSYIEGVTDKVWLASTTELNNMNGQDWNGNNDYWTNPSDEASSTVFEYFKNYSKYKNPVTNNRNTSVAEALITTRTKLAMDGMAGNYSIPVYEKGTVTPNEAISKKTNTSNIYWTRTPSSPWYVNVRVIYTGRFHAFPTDYSYLGARPCIILKY